MMRFSVLGTATLAAALVALAGCNTMNDQATTEEAGAAAAPTTPSNEPETPPGGGPATPPGAPAG
jgi:hypothetical protein